MSGTDPRRDLDAADRLILDTAGYGTGPGAAKGIGAGAKGAADEGELAERSPTEGAVPDAQNIAVVGGAALAAEVSRRVAGGIRVHLDSLTDERAVRESAPGCRLLPLPDAVGGARNLFLRLPRSLDALDELARVLAASVAADAVIVAGGRLKHMTPAQTDVLRRHFARVDILHARQKSRVLLAREPRASAATWPRRTEHPDLGITVVAHGGVFAGSRIDLGTRLLLSVLPGALPGAGEAIDLGCGSGAVAAVLAVARPGIRVLATDISQVAIASTRATAEASGVADRVSVHRDVGLGDQPPSSADLVLLNPPFHPGGAASGSVDASLAAGLFREAARVLRDGGELWTVFNSHLRYRLDLERIVGSTRQVARDARFTVLASRRRPGGG